MINRSDSTRSTRRAAIASAAVAVAGIGVIAAVSMTGPAQANELAPEGSGPFDTIIIATLPPLTFVTVPPPTFILTPITFITIPGTATTAETTTTETTTTLETTTSTTSTTEAASTTEGQAGQAPAEPDYTVEIDVAQINCDGTIHVEYTTTADPTPVGAANHMIVYNPTSNPTEFHVAETQGNASNGAFAFDEPGAADQTYRLLVIGLFDPADPDGPKAIDQADVALVNGC